MQYPNAQIIIAHYPRFTGGKFLLNCLGLSHKVTLQDYRCLLLQLNNRLNPEQKCNLLIKKLNYASNNLKWNDLGLGCYKLFGLENSVDYDHVFENNSNILSPLLSQASLAGIKLPLVSSGLDLLYSQLRVWPNAKIIKLINYTRFVNTFRKNYQPVSFDQERHQISPIVHYWNAIKGIDWPVEPPKTYFDYDQLPDFIKLELTQMFDSEIFSYIDHECAHNQLLNRRNVALDSALIWNVDSIFNYTQFIKELKNLYSKLELTDFNENLIYNYYHSYINTLTKISNHANSYCV